MARFVMVHGAFGGAWVWEPITGPLEAKGHTVETFDLPGSGEDQTPVAEVSLDAYAEKICTVLGEREEQAILVPNSMGGIAATEAAARCPEKVAAIIYVAAFLPADGQSLIELTQLPEGAGDQIQANMVVSGEPPVSTMPEEASPMAIYGNCSEEVTAWAIAHQRPQPVLPFTEKVQAPDGTFDQIPRSYVLCTEDRSIPPALQRRMLETAGVTDVVELATDHQPHLSMTAELVEALDQRAGG
jgi:pimeloyl-ACP methyl ester carboxylesterase